MEKPATEGERNELQALGKGNAKGFGTELVNQAMFNSPFMLADPEFGEGCRYCWSLDRGDAKVMLLNSLGYNHIEQLLDDNPFYPPELSENQVMLEEMELEKREKLREAGALSWEYRFVACSTIYAALVHE